VLSQILFRVVGEPIGQPRATTVPAFKGKRGRGGNRYGMVTTVPQTHPVHGWKNAVKKAVSEAAWLAANQNPELLNWPLFGQRLVFVDAMFLVPRPKILSAGGRVFASGRYDEDNLLKSVYDALNQLAFQDDRQVVGGFKLKAVAASWEEPGAVVRIRLAPVAVPDFPGPDQPVW
jgi:Holliday junction resolvase RusA-like endonuclease